MRIALVPCLVAGAFWSQPVHAQEPDGEAFAGQVFARNFCSECHYVEKDWVDLSQSYAPPFADIADNRQWTDIALRVWLRSPHVEMPNFILSQTEIDNVVAYIGYLRERRGK